MKNSFSAGYKILFVFGLPITFLVLLGGFVILGPWALGLTPWRTEINSWLIYLCITAPVAIGLCAVHLRFAPALELIQILPTYSRFVVAIAKGMNFILRAIYQTKMWMNRAYKGYFNWTFRLVYALLNSILWALALKRIHLVYNIQTAEAVYAGSVAILLVVMTLSLVQLTILKSLQRKLNGNQ